jgi:hypothetical protein
LVVFIGTDDDVLVGWFGLKRGHGRFVFMVGGLHFKMDILKVIFENYRELEIGGLKRLGVVRCGI